MRKTSKVSQGKARQAATWRLVDLVASIDQDVSEWLENNGNDGNGISLNGLANLVTQDVPTANALRDEHVGLPFACMDAAIKVIEWWPLDDAPWAHLFVDPNISVALNYGFALGLRFAYEEQRAKAKVNEAAA